MVVLDGFVGAGLRHDRRHPSVSSLGAMIGATALASDVTRSMARTGAGHKVHKASRQWDICRACLCKRIGVPRQDPGISAPYAGALNISIDKTQPILKTPFHAKAPGHRH
jgi:hypothetical protein